MFTLKLSFEPRERDYKKNLELVNAALDTIKLSEINIKNIESYTAAGETFDEDGKSTSKKYFFGFDEIEFICKQENGKDLHVYQMDAASFPKEEAKNNKEFHDFWEKWHPNRVMRFLAKYEFDKYISYVLFHHEKKK